MTAEGHDSGPLAAGLTLGEDGIVRCSWAGTAPDYHRYHDTEWGRVVEGESALFERLTLEAFQSGLSWLTILRRREGFRRAFAGFDPDTVAGWGEPEIERLLGDPGIIRNRRKIEATLHNAGVVVALRERGGLERLWREAAPSPAPPRPRSADDVTATSSESVALAATLRAAGLRHLGPVTLHAAMQACGLRNDHVVGCAAGDALTPGGRGLSGR